MHFRRGIKLNMKEINEFNWYVIMELIEWLQQISILNIFILKYEVLLGFKSLRSSILNVKKSIWTIFDDRYIQNGLSSGQCFSINTKLLQVTFSRRNMEGSNSILVEKMKMKNALCGTFWLQFQIFRGQKMTFPFLDFSTLFVCPLYALGEHNYTEKVNVAICSHFFLDWLA